MDRKVSVVQRRRTSTALTKAGALKLAARMWGKKAYVEDKRTPSSEALRADAKYALDQLGPEPAGVDIKDRERFPDSMTLGEYRIARDLANAAYKEWRDRRDRAQWRCRYRRYSVGTLSNLAGMNVCHLRGEGDTWQEACEAAGLLPKSQDVTA